MTGNVGHLPTVLPTLDKLATAIPKPFLGESGGNNREKNRQCLISAGNDIEAVHCWLNEYKDVQATYIAYQKESERLLLWAIYQQQKLLSDLNVDDFKAYFAFLANPEPKEHWCARSGGRGNKRGCADWKPFAGPLSRTSIATTTTVINSLISYLVDANYLTFNPLKIIRKKIKQYEHAEHRIIEVKQRILAPDEWIAIVNALEDMPEATRHQLDDKIRLRFIVHMLFFLGLRLNELVSHNWNAFRCEDKRWWFYVLGKGGKLGKVPVNDELLQSVIAYRAHLHFPEKLPQANEHDIPLVTSWGSGLALSARAISYQLKKLGVAAAQQCKDEPEKAAKLRRFSAHWLRHLSASMQDRAGMQFKHIRENHRHKKEDTTRLYVHAYDKERHADMQKLRLDLISKSHD